MTSREVRAKEIQRAIGEVLLRNWDPLGVKDEPQAQDEYDAYVGGVYHLIASGATAKQIAEHLVRVETDRLGYPDTDPQDADSVGEQTSAAERAVGVWWFGCLTSA